MHIISFLPVSRDETAPSLFPSIDKQRHNSIEPTPFPIVKTPETKMKRGSEIFEFLSP
jgi:hypothetical protein